MEPGRNMGAFMVVELGPDQERREAIAGAPVTDGSGNIIAGGIKRDDYRVMLQVFHMSQMDYTEDAVTDLNLLVEAIKQHIRTDRTLNGICTQAGESRYGIQTSTGKPGLDKNERTGIWAQIQFEVMTQFVA
jgi:hypothetical protein